MIRIRRSFACLGLLALAGAALPGCAISVGGSTESDDCDRTVRKLNERLRVVEERLGMASGAASGAASDGGAK